MSSSVVAADGERCILRTAVHAFFFKDPSCSGIPLFSVLRPLISVLIFGQDLVSYTHSLVINSMQDKRFADGRVIY